MPDPLRKTISATEAPALLDASPYITRWMLYRRFAHGEDFSSPGDNRMNWGQLMEPLVIKAAADELHLDIKPNRDDRNEQIYERRGLLGCTRDATAICPQRGPGAVETKCVFDYSVWMEKWSGGKKPPREIEIQLQVQMFVGDGERPFTWGTIPVWLAGEIHYFERKPIPELWERLEAEAKKFFDDVAARNEPPAFGAPMEIPWLAQIFPTQAGKILAMTDPEDRAAILHAENVRMMTWHAQERLGHEKAEKDIKAKLLALATDHEEVLLPYGIKVKIKQQSRDGYTVKPTTFKTVTAYVPKEGVPTGNIGDV